MVTNQNLLDLVDNLDRRANLADIDLVKIVKNFLNKISKKRKYPQKCLYCDFSWAGYKTKTKYCPNCNKTEYDTVPENLIGHDLKIWEYRILRNRLKPGESVLLPWIDTRPENYPDIQMLKLANSPANRKKYEAWSDPRTGLKITRRLIPLE